MCCIISMIGHDVHISANHTHNEVSSILYCLWIVLRPLHLYERVVKWTHEPRSNFNHKKQISTPLLSFIFAKLIKWGNAKYFIISTHISTQKHLFYYFFCLSCLVVDRFTSIYLYFISVLLIRKLVLNNHRGVGDTRK
jgi:hypothetical protein